MDPNARRRWQVKKLQQLGARAPANGKMPIKMLQGMRKKGAERERKKNELDKQMGNYVKCGSFRCQIRFSPFFPPLNRKRGLPPSAAHTRAVTHSCARGGGRVYRGRGEGHHTLAETSSELHWWAPTVTTGPGRSRVIS